MLGGSGGRVGVGGLGTGVVALDPLPQQCT